MGRQAATLAAKIVASNYSPGILISAGFGGALTSDRRAGDVVTAREVIDSETGERYAARSGGSTVLTVSGVTGVAGKRDLASRWNADMIDMEAAAVAEVAQKLGIEFAAVKASSDELEFELPPMAQFVNDAGQFRTMRFVAWLAIRPRWWSVVRRLNANSELAAANLSHVLEHLIDQWSNTANEERRVQA
jgi:adenosylhomocysteine nucleosidase